MRLLVDGLIVQNRSDLMTAIAAREPEWTLETFDSFLPATEIGPVFGDFQPDIVLVDPAWFVMTPLLGALLEVNGCHNSARLIGATQVDNVLKIKTAYHGYRDLVDLSSGIDDVVAQLHDVRDGGSLLDGDRLWLTVPRPEPLVDISSAPEDEFDLAILELICVGMRDKDIANVIYMSHQTVRNRISRMYERSGMSNRTQMAWMHLNQMLVKGMMANPHTRQAIDKRHN